MGVEDETSAVATLASGAKSWTTELIWSSISKLQSLYLTFDNKLDVILVPVNDLKQIAEFLPFNCYLVDADVGASKRKVLECECSSGAFNPNDDVIIDSATAKFSPSDTANPSSSANV